MITVERLQRQRIVRYPLFARMTRLRLWREIRISIQEALRMGHIHRAVLFLVINQSGLPLWKAVQV